MTRAKAKAQRQQIRAWFDEWVPAMGLADWMIGLRVHVAASEETEDDQNSSWGYTVADWGHQTATITINCYNVPVGWMEHTVVHELVHLLTRPMEMALDDTMSEQHPLTTKDIQERCVNHISTALMSVKYGKSFDGSADESTIPRPPRTL